MAWLFAANISSNNYPKTRRQSANTNTWLVIVVISRRTSLTRIARQGVVRTDERWNAGKSRFCTARFRAVDQLEYICKSWCADL